VYKPSHGRFALLLFWSAIVVVYILLRLNPAGIPLDRDEGIFGLVGRTILDGGWPYQDMIDHKPPLIFLIYSFCLWLFPPTALGVHGFLHLYNFITLCVLFCFADRAIGRLTACWTAFIYAVFSINPMVQGFTASTEMFMLLPLSLSLLLAWQGTETGRLRAIYLFLSGFSAAAACWIKQPAFFSALFSLIIIVYRLYSDRTSDWMIPALQAVFLWLLGGTVLSAAIIAPFAAAGLFEDFFYWSFQHNLAYAGQLPWSFRLASFGDGLIKVVVNSPVIFALVCLGLFVQPRRIALPYGFWLLFLLLSALGCCLGYAYAHYYAQLLLALSLLAGLSSARLMQCFALTHPRAIPAALAGMILAGQILPNLNYHLAMSPEHYSRHFFGTNPFPESVEIASFLADRTREDDKIFIFGSEPQILLLAERDSASAFGMIYPLMSKQYRNHELFQQQAIQQIEAVEPAYLVYVMVPTSLLWDRKAELHILQYLNQYQKLHYDLDGLLLFNFETRAWEWQASVNLQSNGVPATPTYIALYRRRGD
jgi:hypothetical protein